MTGALCGTAENTPDSNRSHATVQRQEGLHRHAFWLFGVIVGVAIGDSLRTTVPHVISPPVTDSHGRWPDLLRLVVFLVVIVRFYIGAAAFFDDAHIKETAQCFPKKSFGIDFLFGVTHFILFFAWGISIDIHSKPLKLFPAILAIILAYDLLWFLSCRKFDTSRLIKMWTFINLTTLILGMLTYLLVHYAVAGDALVAEAAAYFWVMLASSIDLAELTTGRKIFRRWLSALVDDEVPAA